MITPFFVSSKSLGREPGRFFSPAISGNLSEIPTLKCLPLGGTVGTLAKAEVFVHHLVELKYGTRKHGVEVSW